MNDNGQYLSLNLPPEAVIYRWGARATKDAIAAGSRVRVTTDPGLKEVWRLDLGPDLHDRGRFSNTTPEPGELLPWKERSTLFPAPPGF